MTLGADISGALQRDFDVDVFIFPLASAQRLRLLAESTLAHDLEVRVEGPLGYTRVLTADSADKPAQLDFSSEESGDYVMSVLSPSHRQGPYRVSLQLANSATRAEAFRFLRLASFGPNETTVAAVMSSGVADWLEQQIRAPSAYDSPDDAQLSQLQQVISLATRLEPLAEWHPSNPNNPDEATDGAYFNGSATRNIDEFQNSAWFTAAVSGTDQLRQRMAYALSQILVVSTRQDQLGRRAEAVAHYADILGRHALGSFRSLLSEVARSPAMGLYLSHQGNEKANPARNTLPDENFARELMQLFTIGLYLMNTDGTPQTDSNGNLIPSYTQTDIEEMSRIMTGWDLRYNARYGSTDGSYVHFMEFTPEFHDFGEKTVLGTTIPADLENGDDLEAALDLLFSHPNTAPFISRQLIQRLVSSNPSPAYVRRVAAAFADNGRGERGDLSAVARAILLDSEAYEPAQTGAPAPGKVNEQLLALLAWYRAFDVQPLPGWQMWSEQAGTDTFFDIYVFQGDRTIGQGAFRSPSVFNFYDADFVPQDAFYRNRTPQYVLPELQQRSANNIAGLVQATNTFGDFLERRHIEAEFASLDSFVAAYNAPSGGGSPEWNRFRNLVLLDYGPVLDAFDAALDGEVDRDYTRINDMTQDQNGLTPKQRAIDAAIRVAESRLLGDRTLEPHYRTELAEELDIGEGFNFGNNRSTDEAVRVCSGAVQSVFLSAQNMSLQ